MSMFSLIEALDKANIDYVVVGGLAVALHGYQRLTMDVDVALAMTPDNVKRFIDCAKVAGWSPVMPVPVDALADPGQIDRWHREKGMLAFSLREPDAMGTALDVLVKPDVAYADLLRDAVRVKVGSVEVPIASIDHLIAMKSGTGRSKDAIDVEELRKIRQQAQQ